MVADNISLYDTPSARRLIDLQTINNCPGKRILFLPVSGPKGIGEYKRSLFLAQRLIEEHPDWDVRITVAENAPYADDVPVPAIYLARSPTLEPDRVEEVLRDFSPHVAVFDCSGRKRSLQFAQMIGAQTVFVSNNARKRKRAFRLSRLRYTDDLWILPPHFGLSDLSFGERLKLKLLGKAEPFYIGAVFPEMTFVTESPDESFFVCCPGGGGNPVRGQQSGAVFAEAAAEVADNLGMQGIMICGVNFTGQLPRHDSLQVHRVLQGGELAGLLSKAQFAMIGGGDVLAQTICIQVPAVVSPVAKDQYGRAKVYEHRGLCLSAAPQMLAKVVIESWRSGELEKVRARLRNISVGGGLVPGVRRLERLAESPTE